MTVSSKLRFLANRAEDKRSFKIITGGIAVEFDYERFATRHTLATIEGIEFELVRPVFTSNEKYILRNVPEDFNYIVRDLDGDLVLYEWEPFRLEGAGGWLGLGEERDFSAFNHLFQEVGMFDKEPIMFRKLI